MTVATVPTWQLAREDSTWVGPITVSIVDDDGQPVDDATIEFAVITKGLRPGAADWTAPVPSPDDSSLIGALVTPVTAYVKQGIWARAVRGDRTVVLQPYRIGEIIRT